MELRSHLLKGTEDMFPLDKLRFWQKEPVRFKLWFINFHLYRVPIALGSDMFRMKNQPYQLTWGEWERRIKKVCPYQYWLREKLIGGIQSFFRYRFQYTVMSPLYSLKKKLTNPDNVLKMPSLGVYADESEQILHANFQILVNYVDQKPEEKIVMDSYAGHKEWWDKVKSLYHYWKVERPKLLETKDNSYPDREDMDYDTPYEVAYAKLIAADKELKERDEDGLIFIVKNREQFWI